MKVLVVDCNIDPTCWGAQDLVRLAHLGKSATVYVRRAPQNDLPSSADGFDRIIVSGSNTPAMDTAPWIDRLLDLIRASVRSQIPFLGVCYGHQMLARALTGDQVVRKAAVPEFGWVEIEALESAQILKGLPSRFYSFEAHYDEVGFVPQDFRVLARSRDCQIQALQFKDLPVFGIQFHPEKTLEAAEKVLSEKEKSKSTPEIFNRHEGKRVFRETIAESIFKNFLNRGV